MHDSTFLCSLHSLGFLEPNGAVRSRRPVRAEIDTVPPPSPTPAAASFRLKNMRLPRMQRRVGLPRASITVAGTEGKLRKSLSMLKSAQDIALRRL